MLPMFHNPPVSRPPIKIVATLANVVTSGTAHTFSGVSFGPAYPGRVLVACIGLRDTPVTAINQIACTIGGVSASGDDRGQSVTGGPTVSAGLWYASVPSGRSGDVFVDWTGPGGTDAALVLISVAKVALPPFDQVGAAGVGAAGTSIVGLDPDVPEHGVVIASAGRSSGSGAGTTWLGLTKRADVAMGAGTLMVAFDKNLPAATPLDTTVSWTGIAVRGGMVISLSRT